MIDKSLLSRLKRTTRIPWAPPHWHLTSTGILRRDDGLEVYEVCDYTDPNATPALHVCVFDGTLFDDHPDFEETDTAGPRLAAETVGKAVEEIEARWPFPGGRPRASWLSSPTIAEA